MKSLGLCLSLAMALSTLFGLSCRGATDEMPSFGWSCVSTAYMRSEPSHTAELASQALMGHPLRLIEQKGEWFLAETSEGYRGWINRNTVETADSTDMERWKCAPRLIVASLEPIKAVADTTTLEPLTDMVNGCIVEGVLIPGARYAAVRLPDGRRAFVDASQVEDLASFASRPFSVARVLALARSMMGAPYLWGGLSVKEADCSGLVKAAYLAAGVILPRDASQQAKVGTPVAAENWDELCPGDLVFFGNGTSDRITHVAIYEGEGNVIHSSGRVRRNSLNPHAPDYIGRRVLQCAAIVPNIGSAGLIPIGSHPLYFSLPVQQP